MWLNTCDMTPLHYTWGKPIKHTLEGRRIPPIPHVGIRHAQEGLGRGRVHHATNTMHYMIHHTLRMSYITVWLWECRRMGATTYYWTAHAFLWGLTICGRFGEGRVHQGAPCNEQHAWHDASHIANIMHAYRRVMMRVERWNEGFTSASLPWGLAICGRIRGG